PRVDIPDGSQVPVVRPTESVGLVNVSLFLAEEEDVFVASRRAVLDAFGLTIGFVPDDVGAEIPSCGLERECQAPGDSDRVFWLQAGRRWRPNAHGTHGGFLVGRAPRSV